MNTNTVLVLVVGLAAAGMIFMVMSSKKEAAPVTPPTPAVDTGSIAFSISNLGSLLGV